MSYWSAKSDLAFLKQFRSDVFELYEYEGRAAKKLREEHAYIPRSEWQGAVNTVANRTDAAGYQQVRQRLAVGMSRAVRIGWARGVPLDMRSYPAPAVGGPIIPVNLFESVLNDTSHGGVERQWVIDALNRTVGAAEDNVRTEKRHAVNPAWWLWSALVFVLRLPFIVLRAAGFDTDKIESELWAKLFKLAYAAGLLYLATRWGIKVNVIP